MPDIKIPKLTTNTQPTIESIADSLRDAPEHLQQLLEAAERKRREHENLTAKVDRIVVLMLENRSFDQMLGWLGPARGGLTGNEVNHERVRDDGMPDPTSPSYRVQPTDDTAFAFVDPKHASISTVQEQIGGGRMSGFVQAFRVTRDERSHDHIDGPVSRRDWQRATLDMPMRHFTRNAVPAYAFLADQFAACSRYFCSVPSGTWPNRAFFYAGTCHGQTGNGSPLHPNDDFHDKMPHRLFVDQLDDAGVSWGIYSHTFAWLNLFPERGPGDNHTRAFGKFADDCRAGTLPKVVLVDPNWIDVGIEGRANDDHAPADIADGQKLVHDVYEALRTQPDGFGRTLFVITYDEHGGWYDHVAPPDTIGTNSVLQSEDPSQGFPSTYGVRVPTFVVSAYIPASTNCISVLDHCSLHATIVRTFCPNGTLPLSNRVARAESLSELLSLDTPRAVPAMSAIASKRSATPAPARYALNDADGGMRAWLAEQTRSTV